MLKRIFTPCIFSLFLSLGVAGEISQAKMLGDIDLIKSVFSAKYAPAEWKKEYLGWDLDSQVRIVKNQILANSSLTIHDYQKLLVRFFYSMKDYHTNIDFFCTEMSFLPFRLQGANGRYFVAWIPKNRSSKKDQELNDFLSHVKVGDEVLAINGTPIDDYVQAFKLRHFGEIQTETDQMQAELYLTLRMACMGYDVEQGSVSITIRHQSGSTVTYMPQWVYVPEQIKNHTVFAKASIYKAKPTVSTERATSFFDKTRMTPIYKHLRNAKRAVEKFVEPPEVDNGDDAGLIVIGAHKSFVPELGKVIWKHSQSHFYAYIFETKKNKKIGYVRIPSYDARGYEWMDFQDIIQRFQQGTDALVIDQLNNPGGYLSHLLALLSMLSDRPLTLLKERIAITQEEVLEAIEGLEDPEYVLSHLEDKLPGFRVTSKDIENVTDYCQLVVDEWDAGHTLTTPLHFCGITSLKPCPQVHYKKPILVLVNSLDFSCADLLPAILQDNKRAKIFGSKTAGAGGYVLSHEYPNLFGVSGFSYSGSIAYRLNNEPLENLGVTPDIPYQITQEDLTNNYKGYVQAVLDAIDTICQ